MIRPLYNALAFCSLLGLSACATGEGASFSMSPDAGDGRAQAALADETVVREFAPHLIAVSGTALLPGSRRPAASLLAARSGLLPAGAVPGAPLIADARAVLNAAPLNGAIGANLQVGTTTSGGVPTATLGASLAAPTTALNADARATLSAPTLAAPQAAATVSAAVAGSAARVGVSANTAAPGPLLAVNGSTSGLLGARTTATLGTSPTAAAALSVGGGASPQTAAARLTATATGVVNRGATTTGGASPVTAPRVGGVPNAGLLGTIAGLLPPLVGR